jgi:hypothetical protein
MQNHPGACSPEMVGSLQRIFDSIWLELESKRSRHIFPWDTQAARFQIAHFVLEHINDAKLDVDQIKRDVLQRLEQSERV